MYKTLRKEEKFVLRNILNSFRKYDININRDDIKVIKEDRLTKYICPLLLWDGVLDYFSIDISVEVQVRGNRILGNKIYVEIYNREILSYYFEQTGKDFDIVEKDNLLYVYCDTETHDIIKKNFSYIEEENAIVLKKRKRYYLETHSGPFSMFLNKYMKRSDYYNGEFFERAKEKIKGLDLYRFNKIQKIDINDMQRYLKKFSLEAKDVGYYRIPLGYSDLTRYLEFTDIQFNFELDYFLNYYPEEYEIEILIVIGMKEVIKAYILNANTDPTRDISCEKENGLITCHINKINKKSLNNLGSLIRNFTNADVEVELVDSNGNILVKNVEPIYVSYRTFEVLNFDMFKDRVSKIVKRRNLEMLSRRFQVEAEEKLKELNIL